MNPLWPDLAGVRLRHAEEAFAAAEVLKAAGHLRDCVNRYYYAVFHATRSLLALEGFDTSRHGHLIGEFRRVFVKTQVVSREASDILGRLFKARSEGDYDDDRSFSSQEVDLLAHDARAFLDEIGRVLRAKGISGS